MAIHVHATYKAGLIFPDRPLGLPENSEIELTVTPSDAARPRRPSSPQISPQDLADRLTRHAVSVGSLPADFLRGDIYQDHD